MKLAILLLGCSALFFTACEDRRTEYEKNNTYRESPQTQPTRTEGPAERTGRIIDEASKRAAEAVGQGLQEAGRQVQKHVPESSPENGE